MGTPIIMEMVNEYMDALINRYTKGSTTILDVANDNNVDGEDEEEDGGDEDGDDDFIPLAITDSSVVHPPQHYARSSSITPKAYHVPPFHDHGQARFSTSPECSVVAPATPVGVIDLNVMSWYNGVGHPSDGMQRKPSQSFPSTDMALSHKLFDGMPLPTSTVDDPHYATFMENIIFEGRGEAFHVDDQGQAFDPHATQIEDVRGHYKDNQFTGHDEYEDDHGNSWHDNDDLYFEDVEKEVDISAEPLVFIDELTQRAKAQKRRQSIRTGSCT
ncbi:putative MO25-like protein [Hordeum vulgare]|nr:putative MO25-like protein [Hordeum vulgare]